MARSKSTLFPHKHQKLAILGHALAHPARVAMVTKLVNADALSYPELIKNIPLSRTTLNQHLRLLERHEIIGPAVLDNGLVGFQLKATVFFDYLSAMNSFVERRGPLAA
jgi:predicted transcriptional regulator